VTLEIGGAEKPYDDQDHFHPEDADLYDEVVHDLLGHAGVLDTDTSDGDAMQELAGLARTYATTAGDVVYHAELGETITAGDTVASIHQDGTVVETYEARTDGILEGRKDGDDDDAYDARVTQGMRLFNIARFPDEG